MSESKREAASSVDIDALFQDTWLQVISLRHGPLFQEGEGYLLWQRCVADIERVQQSLRDEGLDEESRQHILTAHCALLDEAVKSRGVQDDACMQWYDMPLQGQFLGTIDAGDTLCDRMRAVLREPQPNVAVVTCFHRVMLLGFLGSYRSLNDPQREQLVKALNDQVPPFTVPQDRPVLANAGAVSRLGPVFSSWPVRISMSVLILVALWWGLDRSLDRMLATLLPGVIP
nr:type VI secretion system protein TssL, short form [uncultured Erwinia sp.]